MSEKYEDVRKEQPLLLQTSNIITGAGLSAIGSLGELGLKAITEPEKTIEETGKGILTSPQTISRGFAEDPFKFSAEFTGEVLFTYGLIKGASASARLLRITSSKANTLGKIKKINTEAKYSIEV